MSEGCSRCGKQTQGGIVAQRDSDQMLIDNSGQEFVDLRSPVWADLAKPNETMLCKGCVSFDPRFQARTSGTGGLSNAPDFHIQNL